MPFVKLDTGILDSSLWPQRPERELFITALLMAAPKTLKDPMPQLSLTSFEPTGFCVPPGEYGFIEASWTGVVERAKLNLDEQTRKAMEALGEIDPFSRSEAFDGRRLVRVSGGIVVLNYMRYREKDHTAAERNKRYRARKKDRDAVTLRSRRVTMRNVTQAEAEAEAEANKRGNGNALPQFCPPTKETVIEFAKSRKLYGYNARAYGSYCWNYLHANSWRWFAKMIRSDQDWQALMESEMIDKYREHLK